MNKNDILILVTICFAIIGLYDLLGTRYNALKEEDKYRQSIENIHFEGIVKDKTYLFSAFGLCEINLLSTNCNSYDIRSNSDIWSFVVVGNKAEVLVGNYQKIEIGDKITFDGKYLLYYRNEILYHHEYPNVLNLIYDDRNIRDKHKL